MLTLLAALSLQAAAQSWDSVGVCGFTSNEAQYTSIALDAAGRPYVAYVDADNNSRATVMKFNAGAWDTVGHPGLSGNSVNWTSMAIAPSGQPFIAYSDESNGSKASVMKFDGINWVQEGIPGFSAGSVEWVSMAIDKSGTPYVVYEDFGNDNHATVMKYDGTSWVNVGNAGFSTYGCSYTSIAIDTGGVPYVAYQGGAAAQAVVMKFNGSHWVTVGGSGFSAGAASYTSIAIDSADTPYVVYQDWQNYYRVTVMKYNGSSWVNVGSPGFSPGNADWTSIAIWGTTPYVVYQDYSSDDAFSYKATTMVYNGSSWDALGGAGFSAANVQYTTIAIDAGGVPYVAYQDGARGGKATVMRYGSPAGIRNVNATAASLAIFPNPGKGYFKLNITSAQNDNATVIITNMLGEKVKEFNVRTNMDNEVQMDDVPGIYFISAVMESGARVGAKVVVE